MPDFDEGSFCLISKQEAAAVSDDLPSTCTVVFIETGVVCAVAGDIEPMSATVPKSAKILRTRKLTNVSPNLNVCCCMKFSSRS